MNPFDKCDRFRCGHVRGAHLAGEGCVWCSCPGFVEGKKVNLKHLIVQISLWLLAVWVVINCHGWK